MIVGILLDEIKVVKASVVNSPVKSFLRSSNYLNRTTVFSSTPVEVLNSLSKAWKKTKSSKFLVTVDQRPNSSESSSPKNTTTTSLSS
jgi:hypothetical protein